MVEITDLENNPLAGDVYDLLKADFIEKYGRDIIQHRPNNEALDLENNIMYQATLEPARVVYENNTVVRQTPHLFGRQYGTYQKISSDFINGFDENFELMKKVIGWDGNKPFLIK